MAARRDKVTVDLDAEIVERTPKSNRYVDALAKREFVERVERHAEIIDDPSDPPAVTRDPDDDYLVALAVRAGVDALVSGDRDLLEAGPALPPVWTPRGLAEHARP